MTLSRYASILALAGLLSASPARADDARAIDVAKRSFEAGQAQYRSNDLEGARISFAQSYAAWPAVETLRILAITELNTNRFVDALRHFKAYAKDKNADPEFVRAQLPGFLARCNARVGHLRITANPGAVVLVDGRRVVDLSETVDVLPGPHAVAERGSDPRSVNVALQETVDVVLGTGALSSQGPLPAASPVASEQPANETHEALGFWTPRNAWTISLGAASVVSAAIGIGFGVEADSHRSSFNDAVANGGAGPCKSAPSGPQCTALTSTASSQRTDAYATDVAFGVAGAFAVAAVVLFATWPAHDERHGRSLWITPAIGQGAGAVAGGTF